MSANKTAARRPSARERRPSARERLLAAASELFYDEGVHTVGVDRITERAGVAKATLYTLFGSKDGLVRAYLQDRHDRTRDRMTRELAARFGTPRERLLGVFEVQGLSCSTTAPGSPPGWTTTPAPPRPHGPSPRHSSRRPSPRGDQPSRSGYWPVSVTESNRRRP
jgi:AcrR family transcriptional regulator